MTALDERVETLTETERLEIEANIARVMGAIVRSIERSAHVDQTR